MAVTVSFINFKGGVGKTTLCVEVGASLAYKFGERVLLVDLDPQTNATLSLMSEKDWEAQAASRGTLLDFFKACLGGLTFDISQIRVKTPVKYGGGYLDKLDLLPSHLELFGMDLELATRYGHGDIKPKLFLRDALKSLSAEYDYILIDCPPNLYLATQNGLFASDNYVIVALAEYLSTVGIGYIQKAIRQIFQDTNDRLLMAGNMPGSSSGLLHTPKLVGIIFNRLRTKSSGTRAEEAIISRIELDPEYRDKVFKTKVPMSTKIAERPSLKVPIAVSGYAEDKDYEERIRQVAEEFYDRLTQP